MLFDGISLTEQSKATNLTVDSGLVFPSNPNIGELFFLSSDMSLYSHDGADWSKLLTIKDSIYDISLSYPSEVSTDDFIMLFSVPRSMKLVVDTSMYNGKSLIPGPIESIFTILKNKTVIGEITFGPNMSTPIFDIFDETFFAQNDVLGIKAPTTLPHGGICVSMKAILT
jgi:hypothetical protein